MTNRTFTRDLRLLRPSEFKQVLDAPQFRASQANFVLLARLNALPNARIGFVLPKRRVPLAVARNRVKRIIREAFRAQQDLLAGLDIVVMARDGLPTLDNPTLRAAVDRQFQYLASRRTSPKA